MKKVWKDDHSGWIQSAMKMHKIAFSCTSIFKIFPGAWPGPRYHVCGCSARYTTHMLRTCQIFGWIRIWIFNLLVSGRKTVSTAVLEPSWFQFVPAKISALKVTKLNVENGFTISEKHRYAREKRPKIYLFCKSIVWTCLKKSYMKTYEWLVLWNDTTYETAHQIQGLITTNIILIMNISFYLFL